MSSSLSANGAHSGDVLLVCKLNCSSCPFLQNILFQISTHVNLLDGKRESKYPNLESQRISSVPFVSSDFQLLNDLNLVSKKDPFDGLSHDPSLGGSG